MAWIKTVDGKLLNLNTVSTIEVVKPLMGSYQLIATESAVRGHQLTKEPLTKEQAEATLEVLRKMLGAVTIDEFAESIAR